MRPDSIKPGCIGIEFLIAKFYLQVNVEGLKQKKF